MKKYNSEKIVKVTLNDFYKSSWWTYKEEKKFLGIIVTRKGFHSRLGDYQKECPERHVLRDGVVYEKPEVVIVYESDEVRTFIFDSYDKAKATFHEYTKEEKFD